MSLNVQELALAHHGAWVDVDRDAIISLHSADSVFHMHGAAEPTIGKEAIRELVVALKLVPDLDFEPEEALLGRRSHRVRVRHVRDLRWISVDL